MERRMNKFTLLANHRGSFRGMPIVGRDDEPGRTQHFAGIRDPGGECRHLFGVGEGPTEAVAEAKQESGDQCLSRTCESRRVGQKWVSRHVLATCH
jgi:hypothetical protein